jgi:hypothetical protein
VQGWILHDPEERPHMLVLPNEGDPQTHLVIKIDECEALDNSPEPLETMKEVAEVFLTHPDDIGDGQFLDRCRGRRPSVA